MSKRIRNNVNSARYRDRNKMFANYNIGALIKISPENPLAYAISLRPVSKNNKDKFVYTNDTYTFFDRDQVALYVGRYDGRAVLLVDEGLYACPIEHLNKIEKNNS